MCWVTSTVLALGQAAFAANNFYTLASFVSGALQAAYGEPSRALESLCRPCFERQSSFSEPAVYLVFLVRYSIPPEV